MPILSIVACRMLEDELVHLLSADGEVRELLIVDRMQALSLSAKLKGQNRPHLLLSPDRIAPHLQERQNRRRGIFFRCRASRKAEGTVIVISPLPLGLHSDLEQLRAAVYDNIRSLSSFSDGILIFYGKCGGFLANLEDDLPDLPCPIYFLTDESGERIEDCIALALGGNENYDHILAEHQDAALFMTPMWASNWSAMGDEAASGKRRDLRTMIKSSGMKKVAQINTGLCVEPGFTELVADFAREFGLQRIELPGGTAVAKYGYERARSCLAAARPRSAHPGAEISGSFNSRLAETIRVICRMTRKKSLEE